MARARKKPTGPLPIESAKVHGFSPSMVRRMMDRLKAEAKDPRVGYELGRLYLNNTITDLQFRAGTRYCELRQRWRAANGMPAPTVRAQAIGAVRGLSLVEDNGSGAAVCAAMAAADDALNAAGTMARKAIDLVVDRDCLVVGYEMQVALIAGLEALITHWRMR